MDEKELLKMKENNDEDLASRVWIETMKAIYGKPWILWFFIRLFFSDRFQAWMENSL
jgi:hypothetical protein